MRRSSILTLVAGSALAITLSTGITGAFASAALSVAIVSAPPSPSSSPTATFVWRANEPASFTCVLDDARATSCASPATYAGLAPGQHVFTVIATNSDRSGTHTARAVHRWTVQLSGGPPPPPPPPAETAMLLVAVEGGGSVSSSPAGIACPGDCAQAFPLGAAVTLAATPGAGFALTGWGGGCSGVGACAVRLSSPTLVAAAFGTVARASRLYRGDTDSDGTPDASDACPASPRVGRKLSQGCTAVDLLHGSNVLVDELRAELVDVRRQFGVKGLAGVGRDLGSILGLVDRGATLLASGDPCAGAALVRQGSKKLDAVSGKATRLVASLQKALTREKISIGDASDKDLRSAGLDHRRRLLEEIEKHAQTLARALGGACGGGGGPEETIAGRIEKTDDGDGVLQLADGRFVALGDAVQGTGGIWEGGRVRIEGRQLPGGRWLAEEVTTVDKGLGPLKLAPCMKLQIVPVQRFLMSSNLVRHSPTGYRFGNVLRLEAGMRLGASPECPSAKNGRYSLRIVLSGGGKFYTAAEDLDANDPPVELPVGAGATSWTIYVYERRQAPDCPTQSSTLSREPAAVAKSFPCPAQLLSTTKYDAKVLDQGAYGRATYSQTIFPLESSAPQQAKVEALYPAHYTLPGGWSFEAEGYTPGGLPGPLSTVKLNQTFALWPDSFYGAPLLFPKAMIGVDHYAGLIWPRVVGERNGKPYRYSVALPELVKDLLPGCTNAKCFYRLPWKVGTLDVTSQGNGPGFSHNGQQQYAFDFGMDDGETIYATRGGIVGDLRESGDKNYNPCKDNDGNGVDGDEGWGIADGPSNYVRVDHQDGLYSYYAHVRKGSVVPEEGDVVERGDVIAKIGNTGRSCGPHLHYQVASDPSNEIYGQTAQICFEGWLFKPLALFTPYACYIPDDGALMLSTNG